MHPKLVNEHECTSTRKDERRPKNCYRLLSVTLLNPLTAFCNLSNYSHQRSFRFKLSTTMIIKSESLQLSKIHFTNSFKPRKTKLKMFERVYFLSDQQLLLEDRIEFNLLPQYPSQKKSKCHLEKHISRFRVAEGNKIGTKLGRTQPTTSS